MTLITLRRSPDRARVRVEGALDLATRDRFLAEVDAALAAGPVELDVRALDYIDSTGFRALVEADRRVLATRGAQPRLLIAEEGPVRWMLELTLFHLTLDVRIA